MKSKKYKSKKYKYTKKNKKIGGAFIASKLGKKTMSSTKNTIGNELPKSDMIQGQTGALGEKISGLTQIIGPSESNKSEPAKSKPPESKTNDPPNSGLFSFIKEGGITLVKVLGAILSVPVRNLDEIIPPQLCSRFIQNDFVCSQSMLQYLFTGSKKDYKKMLLPQDKENCITYDEKGNRIVQCNIKGGSKIQNQKNYKGGTATEMIIDCKKTDHMNKDPATGQGPRKFGLKSGLKPGEIDQNKLNKHLERKLKLLLDKLIKVNLYLRKYQCPKDKIISLIEKITNKKLLEKMLELCNTLLGDYEYKTSLSDENRALHCDQEFKDDKRERGEEYKKELKVVPETKYMRMWYEEGDTECETCSNPWPDLFGKYACLFSSSLAGSKNEIHYILLNIIQDMSVIESGTEKAIYTNIKHITKNIDCRSNLRKVLETQIQKLK